MVDSGTTWVTMENSTQPKKKSLLSEEAKTAERDSYRNKSEPPTGIHSVERTSVFMRS